MFLNKNAGFGMVEVLVAALLLAVGVLGFSAMQTRSLQSSNEALSRTKAMILARDLSERIRNNSTDDAVLKSYYNALQSASIPTEKACNTGCTSADLASNDVRIIRKMARDDELEVKMITCPGVKGNKLSSTETTGYGGSCVIVSWRSTEPTMGNGVTDCIKADGMYGKDSRCIVMEVL